MLLSEMIQVKMDTEFGVEMFDGKFKFMQRSGHERLYHKSGSGEWAAVDAAWMLYGVIESAPQPDPITGLVPCDFCTDTFDQKPLLQENKYKPYTCMMSTISIEENNGKHQIEIDLWDGGNVYAAFEINYCPMCGRKLTAPPRPGAIGPGTGEMAPNGDEGASE